MAKRNQEETKKQMEHREAEELLTATLEEEKQTDALLTEIAMSEANVPV